MASFVKEYEKSTPFNYPGQRHEGNFVLVGGEEIVAISENFEEAIAQSDELLQRQGYAPVSERVPVLAFGRIASPEGVSTKLGKYKNGVMSTEELGTFPMFKATLPQHDVVWHGRPGQNGGFFSKLVAVHDAPDASVEARVLFLTDEQLASIHTTEGMSYEVSQIPNVMVGDTTITAVGYTAHEAHVLLDDAGKTIGVKGIERSGQHTQEMDAREVLAYALGRISTEATMTAEAYVAQSSELTLAMRKRRQRNVGEQLQKVGLSKPFTYESDGHRFSRADFDSLPRGLNTSLTMPHTIQLMESHVAAIRPTAEALEAEAMYLQEKDPTKPADALYAWARRRLDPAHNLRRKANEELLDPIREKRLARWRAHWNSHDSNKSGNTL